MKSFVIAGKEKSTDKELLASYDKEEVYGEQRYRNGLTEGHVSGLLEGKREVAKNLINDGISIDVVSKNTGLSIKELKELNI